MPKKIAKDIEKAVKAAQIYIGCLGTARVSDQQKLYSRMNRSIASVAKKRGMNVNDANEQIIGEAKRRGGVCPLPGKDL